MELPLVECNKKEFKPRWARDSRPKCGLRVLPSHLDGQTAWCPGVLSWAKIRYRCVEPKDPKKYWWSKPRDTAAITRHLHNHFQIKFRGTLVKVLGLPFKTSRKCLTPLSRTEISWFLNLLFGAPPPPPLECGRHIWKPLWPHQKQNLEFFWGELSAFAMLIGYWKRPLSAVCYAKSKTV